MYILKTTLSHNIFRICYQLLRLDYSVPVDKKVRALLEVLLFSCLHLHWMFHLCCTGHFHIMNNCYTSDKYEVCVDHLVYLCWRCFPIRMNCTSELEDVHLIEHNFSDCTWGIYAPISRYYIITRINMRRYEMANISSAMWAIVITAV